MILKPGTLIKIQEKLYLRKEKTLSSNLKIKKGSVLLYLRSEGLGTNKENNWNLQIWENYRHYFLTPKGFVVIKFSMNPPEKWFKFEIC